jgi:hypothetical protein
MYKPGGPAFFLFSGESEISANWIQTGFIIHNYVYDTFFTKLINKITNITNKIEMFYTNLINNCYRIAN